LNFSPCEIITTVQCDTDKDSNHITGEEHVSTDISRYKWSFYPHYIQCT